MKMDNEQLNDKWYNDVQNIIINNQHCSPDFIGHCCEIKSRISDTDKYRSTGHMKQSSDGLLYNGCLHFPELHILLPPSIISHVDVHGFSEDNSSLLHGLLYGVVDRECASDCYKLRIYPNGTNSLQLEQFK